LKRKGISTSVIRSRVSLIEQLPEAQFYELGFFRREDLERIVEFFSGKRIGVHAPFVFRYKNHHPAPTSLDEKERRDTYSVNRECALLARGIGAEYVVVHFPNAIQRENWLSVYGEAVEHFGTLNEILPVRVENVYGNDHFHTARDYASFLRDTGCTMCLDVGHLLIDSKVYGFSARKFVEELADLISEVHLYYADLQTYKRCHHAPWGDSEEFLDLLEFLKGFDVDFVIEATPECADGLEKLFSYWRDL